MINKEPDYSGYSIDDLKCALSSIDEAKYPERANHLKDLIAKHQTLLSKEKERKIKRAKEHLQKSGEVEYELLKTNSFSGSKVALFVGNLIVTLAIVFHFFKEPTIARGVASISMILLVVGLLELAISQLKVSLDNRNLYITQLGFKLFRRNKTIPLSIIKSISQKTTSTTAKGIQVKTYFLQALLKNGDTQHLTSVKTEEEGLRIADIINRVIDKA